MYKRLSMIMFPILLVALIGTGMWGYMEHQEKNSVLIKAENQYQRAFHDLSYHVDKLHKELGNTLTLNSTSQDSYKKGLINVWRITSQAQNEISQLPLTLLPFNKTEDFLSKISNFAYQAAVRDLSKQPLDDNEMKTLNTLYQHAGDISTELRGVQAKVLQSSLHWMDVELALAKQEPYDNAIIDGFTTVDKKVGEYEEINWSPSVMSVYQKRDMSMLSGEETSADQVKQKAAQFLGLQDGSSLQVVENGAGTEYQSYSVSAPKTGTNDGQAHMDFSKKGAHLLWFSADRDVPEKKLDLRTARDAAAQFLDEHDYKDMTAVSYDEFNNTATVTFATQADDVINYLEKVSVKVALDNGEVTGLQATDYVYDKKERQIKAPKLTAEQARNTLSPSLQADSVRKAIIRNDINEEVLCYQYTGRVNGGIYRIYVNADSGAQEKVDRIGEQEAQVSK